MNNSLNRLLAIDTSTSSMTAALLEGDRLLAESKTIVERNHSIYLVPSIVELLESAGSKLRQLDGISVGKGPGSYTGVRIGASVAKTLAWTLSIPIIGVSSLEAMALGAYSNNPVGDKTWIVPMMDARRGQVYTGLYTIQSGITVNLVPDGVRPLTDWLDQLSSLAAVDVDPVRCLRFAGETSSFLEILNAPREWHSCSPEILETSIHAYDIGRLAQARWEHGESDDVHSFVPNYTQVAEAEAKYLARQT